MITVFYSWQSDLPSKANRNFIQGELKKAIKEINNDITIELEIRVDQDTKGTTGSPDISRIIFDKITNSDIFVGDISIVCTNRKRYFPNPNVLVEYGYALGYLGWENVIGVFNTAYGRVENLPFDLNHRRPLLYLRTEENREKNNLAKDLQSAIRAIISRSRNLIKISRTKIIQSLIDELEDNLHVYNTTTVTSPLLFENTKYKQAGDNDLRTLIPNGTFENIRSIYTLFGQTNTLISQLKGDGTKDHFVSSQINEVRNKMSAKIQEVSFELKQMIEQNQRTRFM